jgi:UDP-N-acetylglucosamine 2-epimerase (non-hydrolysing)
VPKRAKQPVFPVIVIGTRAQLVKMVPVLLALEDRGINYRLVFTGQHIVTMQALLDDFGVRTVAIWLGNHREIDSMGKMALWFPRALWRLAVSQRWVLRAPNGRRGLVIVHGDTVSTLLGALAARLNRCFVAHVESGLRSFSIRDPFPEELTRLMVFRLIHVAFCPGPWAVSNMQRYRVERVDTGANTLLDAVRYAVGDHRSHQHSTVERLRCVVSIHRHENLSSRKRLTWILETVREIARSHRVDFVLHPSTRARLHKTGELEALASEPGIQLRDRMGYIEFMTLLAESDFLVTDGGSNQEETSYLGIPTLIARERSERPEGLGINAELISPEAGRGWQSQLAAIRERLNGPRSDLSSHHPSHRIVEWLTSPHADGSHA